MTEKNDNNKINAPGAVYQSYRIFHSYEEEQEYTAKKRAELSYQERLRHAEILRKQVYGDSLKSHETSSPLSNSFRIMKPYTNDPDKKL